MCLESKFFSYLDLCLQSYSIEADVTGFQSFLNCTFGESIHFIEKCGTPVTLQWLRSHLTDHIPRVQKLLGCTQWLDTKEPAKPKIKSWKIHSFNPNINRLPFKLAPLIKNVCVKVFTTNQSSCLRIIAQPRMDIIFLWFIVSKVSFFSLKRWEKDQFFVRLSANKTWDCVFCFNSLHEIRMKAKICLPNEGAF